MEIQPPHYNSGGWPAIICCVLLEIAYEELQEPERRVMANEERGTNPAT